MVLKCQLHSTSQTSKQNMAVNVLIMHMRVNDDNSPFHFVEFKKTSTLLHFFELLNVTLAESSNNIICNKLWSTN